MAASTTSDEIVQVDDSFYSRTRYVLGDKAMSRMARSNVFLSGLGGLGVEIGMCQQYHRVGPLAID
jgi:ubiquitin-activating enzyme E1-like protein 2